MSEPRYTRHHLDLDQLPLLTNPWRALSARAVALGWIRLTDGQGYTFTHSHAEQEEVYAALEGEGLLWVDGEEIPLRRGDHVRVAPPARRALKAAEGCDLLVLCAGAVPAGYPRHENARYLIDDGTPHYEDVPPWYAGDEAGRRRNAELRERMERSRPRRKD